MRGDVFANDSRRSIHAAQRRGPRQTRFGEASRIASSCYGGEGGRSHQPSERCCVEEQVQVREWVDWGGGVVVVVVVVAVRARADSWRYYVWVGGRES